MAALDGRSVLPGMQFSSFWSLGKQHLDQEILESRTKPMIEFILVGGNTQDISK